MGTGCQMGVWKTVIYPSSGLMKETCYSNKSEISPKKVFVCLDLSSVSDSNLHCLHVNETLWDRPPFPLGRDTWFGTAIEF